MLQQWRALKPAKADAAAADAGALAREAEQERKTCPWRLLQTRIVGLSKYGPESEHTIFCAPCAPLSCGPSVRKGLSFLQAHACFVASFWPFDSSARASKKRPHRFCFSLAPARGLNPGLGAGWLVGRWVGGCWLVGCLVGCLVGWMVGWMVGWLVGWLAGWLVGWSVGWAHHHLLGVRAAYWP